MRQLVLAMAGAALSAGCSSIAQKAAGEAPVTCHYAHMESVERQARLSGVSLYWVNCPLFRNTPLPEGAPVRVAAAPR